MLLLVSVCAYPVGCGLAEASALGALTITFDYEKQPGLASNQFAVWIEDMDGNIVKTLCVTHFTANGGFRIRPDILPVWVQKSDIAFMDAADVDAVAGSTPETGQVSFTWDLTGMDDDAAAPGSYQFFVEGSLRWNNRVMFSGIIDTAGEAAVVPGAPVYFYERAAAGWPALAADALEHNMITAVEATWQPAGGS